MTSAFLVVAVAATSLFALIGFAVFSVLNDLRDRYVADLADKPDERLSPWVQIGEGQLINLTWARHVGIGHNDESGQWLVSALWATSATLEDTPGIALGSFSTAAEALMFAYQVAAQVGAQVLTT